MCNCDKKRTTPLTEIKTFWGVKRYRILKGVGKKKTGSNCFTYSPQIFLNFALENIDRTGNYSEKGLTRFDPSDRGPSDGWVSALLLVCGTLIGCPLSSSDLPRRSPLRAFLGCWLYLGMVLGTAYLAAYKSLVASRPGPQPVSSVEELASRTDIPVGQSSWCQRRTKSFSYKSAF